ncbi:MAG: hypothetical protein Q9183_001395 [Haloplaca sp. 2 TL-2023]
MAAAFNRLGLATLSHSRRIQCRRKPWTSFVPHHPFHSSQIYRASKEEEREDSPDSAKRAYAFEYDRLDPQVRHHYDLLSPQEKLQYQDEDKQAYEHMTSSDIESQLQGEVSQAAYDVSQETPRERVPIEKIVPGLMAMGEIDEQDSGEDDDFEGDDITSTAHGELEQHREIRDYARIAAWEMPMLSSMYSCALPCLSNINSRFRCSRTCQTIRPSFSGPAPPLPLHDLHG